MIVQLLLVHGADINAEGGCYRNASNAASSGGHARIVRLSREHGVDGNARIEGFAVGDIVR